ncbi:putative Armadillo/beta-catenin-like repeat family protein [Hibiscus syriacus]|uniref:Peroxiredoxin-like 2A n=1 Tax=Hibiscus syriacus TaxID=106335 RepID=A0A6A2XRR5_HIBSY|nr:putative Armadillo/beta-catenin-like repeat family protein [Hibiscus syriacus]
MLLKLIQRFPELLSFFLIAFASNQTPIRTVEDYLNPRPNNAELLVPGREQPCFQALELFAKPKFTIPSFKGDNDPDWYIEWEGKVDLMFAYHDCPQAKQVHLITTQFEGYARTWWMQTRKKIQNFQIPTITSWTDLKQTMRKRFLPTHYTREVKLRLDRLRQCRSSVEEYYKDRDGKRAGRVRIPPPPSPYPPNIFQSTTRPPPMMGTNFQIHTRLRGWADVGRADAGRADAGRMWGGANITEKEDVTVSRFIVGLNSNIIDLLDLQGYENLEDALKKAMTIEAQIQKRYRFSEHYQDDKPDKEKERPAKNDTFPVPKDQMIICEEVRKAKKEKVEKEAKAKEVTSYKSQKNNDPWEMSEPKCEKKRVTQNLYDFREVLGDLPNELPLKRGKQRQTNLIQGDPPDELPPESPNHYAISMKSHDLRESKGKAREVVIHTKHNSFKCVADRDYKTCMQKRIQDYKKSVPTKKKPRLKSIKTHHIDPDLRSNLFEEREDDTCITRLISKEEVITLPNDPLVQALEKKIRTEADLRRLFNGILILFSQDVFLRYDRLSLIFPTVLESHQSDIGNSRYGYFTEDDHSIIRTNHSLFQQTMASFSIKDFVGDGVLKELLPKLLEEGWDDVPTLKIMNSDDMDAINMTQNQKDALEIRTYLHDRALMQYGDKLEASKKCLPELLNLRTEELSSRFNMKRGHIARFTDRGNACTDPLPKSYGLAARQNTAIPSRNNTILKIQSIAKSFSRSSTYNNRSLEESLADFKIKDGYIFKGIVAARPAEARACGCVQPPPVVDSVAPYATIENISVQRLTPVYKIGMEPLVKSKTPPMKASELWRYKPTVLLCIRRPGCIMCRAEAHQLYAKKPIFDALGIQMLAVLHEHIESEVKDFWPRYWGGVVILDRTMGFFKALGDQNLKGEGEIKGGLFIVGQGGTGIAYQFIERNFGDWAPVAEVVEICARLQNQQHDQGDSSKSPEE